MCVHLRASRERLSRLDSRRVRETGFTVIKRWLTVNELSALCVYFGSLAQPMSDWLASKLFSECKTSFNDNRCDWSKNVVSSRRVAIAKWLWRFLSWFSRKDWQRQTSVYSCIYLIEILLDRTERNWILASLKFDHNLNFTQSSKLISLSSQRDLFNLWADREAFSSNIYDAQLCGRQSGNKLLTEIEMWSFTSCLWTRGPNRLQMAAEQRFFLSFTTRRDIRDA